MILTLETAVVEKNMYSWNLEAIKTFRYNLKYTSPKLSDRTLLISQIEGVRQTVMPNILNPECDCTFSTDVFTISFTNSDPTNSPFDDKFESLEIILTETTLSE